MGKGRRGEGQKGRRGEGEKGGREGGSGVKTPAQHIRQPSPGLGVIEMLSAFLFTEQLHCLAEARPLRRGELTLAAHPLTRPVYVLLMEKKRFFSPEEGSVTFSTFSSGAG